ncbi:hypothetical protein BT96DRAFT_1010135 [Gymnopus androsaceus JB14]|uniref:Uncharacterized protein n=1 Tax=Gymnopus androsaceus JB14 TaxID=1447944 RepID=A0A6A4GB34_9AGAR|nr:hypothetical protein BT96DRAFT_1010135 [Gymnopus androsaceus JB14]
MFSSSKRFSFIILLGGLLAPETLAQSNAVAYNAGYDNLTAGIFGVPLPPTYEELNYTNWEVFTSPPLKLATTSSPPNIISLGFGPTNGSMSVSNTSRVFDLAGFYFGCAALGSESLLIVLVSCTVLVTGYSNGQQLAPSARYVYNAPGPLQNVTVLGNGFLGLDEVRFQVAPEADLQPILGLDNLRYNMYDKC